MSGWIAGICVALILLAWGWFALGEYPVECRAHGGSHVAYPYKSMPECYTDDGRRVFW